jgi:hypothetical protein
MTLCNLLSLSVFVQFNGDCVPLLLYCEELYVWIIVCECLFETVGERVCTFFARQCVNEDVDLSPVKEVAVFLAVKVNSSMTSVQLKTLHKVLHGNLRKGTRAPRRRSLGTVLGADTIGAFRNVASFPLRSSLPSFGTEGFAGTPKSSISVPNTPLTVRLLCDGEWVVLLARLRLIEEYARELLSVV